jgi:integrase/recombinase XerC
MSGVLTMDQAVETFLFSRKAANRSEATIACYQYSLDGLKAFATDWPPTPDQIRAFLADCHKRGLADTTIVDHWRRLAVWFGWLQAEEYLASNPMDRVLKPSEPDLLPRGIPPTDIKAMLDYLGQEVNAAGADPWPRRDLALIAFLFDTGARSGEVRTLKKADLSLRKRAALVKGKGNRERLITFGQQAQQALKAWLEVHPNGSELVFITSSGKAMSRFALRRVVKRVADKAGVDSRVTPHGFRHSATLSLLDLGANPVDVQELMGHRDFRITARYAKASVKHRRRLHEKHSPLDHVGQLVADEG